MSGGYFTPDDRRPPITPALAVRVATLGFIALALFGIIFFRLWFLQVLAGDDYLSRANQNQVRDVAIAAPRGDVVDRHGEPIVRSRLANVVQIDPRELPQAERDAAASWGQEAGKLATQWRRERAARAALITKRAKATKAQRRRLPKPGPALGKAPPLPSIPDPSPELRKRFAAIGKILDLRVATIQRRAIQSLAILPYGSIRLRIDVDRAVIQYLQERKQDFAGVVSDTIYLREYPEGRTAAQLLGNVGEVDPKELKKQRFRGVLAGTVVGKGGIEYTYDRYLRGQNGARRLQVDSLGNFFGELTDARDDPQPGRQVKLSIDLGLQKEGERALGIGMSLARQNGNAGTAGAFVAMNPGNGQIYAMGSAPSFNPSLFTKPISKNVFDALNSDAAGRPLIDRAAEGAYATGSVFKPITALAALSAGKVTTTEPIVDGGCMKIGAQERCNANKTSYGPVDLRRALEVSSDIYFYNLGWRTNSARTEVIQSMAKRLGLGHTTGIDLPSGTAGLVPDWRWRKRQADLEGECRRKRGIPLGDQYSVYAAAARGCGVSDMRQWSEGDNVSLAVGQGDLQASPLQMAVAYSSIVTGGRVPRPHLGLQVEEGPNGRLVQTIQKPPARKVKIDPAARTAVLDGLHAAASGPNGTSTAVWSGGSQAWDQSRYPVFGKTGTAQKTGEDDQSWYVCWIKDTTKPNDPGIVIAVTIEKGGFGAEAAAPAARLIASKFFKIKGQVVEGTSKTR